MDLKELGDLRPNSNAYKAQHEDGLVPQEKKFDAVVSGKTQRPSLGRRFVKTFFKEDSKNIKNYILSDVVIPSVVDLVVNAIVGGVQMLFYGNASPNKSGGLNYHKVNSAAIGSKQKEERLVRYSYGGSTEDFNFDDVILDTMGDCTRLIADMRAAIAEYGSVSIADLYDLIGVTNSNFMNYKYGWKNLDKAGCSRIRSGGFVLDLPPVVKL